MTSSIRAEVEENSSLYEVLADKVANYSFNFKDAAKNNNFP